MGRIRGVHITSLDVDAIVNRANEGLLISAVIEESCTPLSSDAKDIKRER